MDLIPKPEQVVSAASNVAHKMLYGHIADLRRMPRTLIDEGPLREVYHYRPAKQVRTTGDPVLLVTPLAAPSTCYDLRRGCSVVEHFVQQGRPTYLVEYGEISFRDRNLGIEHWVGEVVPEAIRVASEHAGGRPVHVVGWSLGGIFAVLVAASQPKLPIATLTVVGSPFDVRQVPMVAPLRPLLNITDGGLVTQLYRALGGAPKPLVRRAFQLSSGTKLLTKPLATLQHLDDTEWLAQIEAVDHFTANMIAYPGRTFGQLYHRVLKANQLRDGVVHHEGRDIRVDAITLPVLVFAGNTDGIAPINAVRRLVDLLPNAAEVRFEIVPGGPHHHVGRDGRVDHPALLARGARRRDRGREDRGEEGRSQEEQGEEDRDQEGRGQEEHGEEDRDQEGHGEEDRDEEDRDRRLRGRHDRLQPRAPLRLGLLAQPRSQGLMPAVAGPLPLVVTAPSPSWQLAVVLVVLLAVAVLASTLGRLGVRRMQLLAALRATAQLAVVSLVIAAALASVWWSAAFAALMFVVASFTSTRRIGVPVPRITLVGLAILSGALPVLALVLGSGVVPFNGAGLVPTAGIIIGNAMTGATLTGRRAFDELRSQAGAYEAALAIGLPSPEAAYEVIGPTAREALIPSIDQTRTVGLVTLPGAFIGVLLGGGSAVQAGAAQLLVLVGVLAAQAITASVLLRLVSHGRLVRHDLAGWYPR